jgi:hypothetical protein
MTSQDETFQKWARWIQTILDDVQGTLLNRYVFREVQSIVAANPKIHQASAFYDWMTTQYQVTASVGVRRQLDVREDSISLARLLTQVQKHPDILTRDRHVAAFTERGYPEEAGNDSFDELAGDGEPRIQPDAVAVELNDFRAKGERIRVHTNKRIAHTDADDLAELPTNADLEASLECMERLVKRYVLLLRGDSYGRLVPTFAYDWKAIFYHPWIPTSPDVDELDEEE